MITFEELQDAACSMGRDYPATEAWVHHRGFDEDDLHKWLVHNAYHCLVSVAQVAPETLAGVSLESALDLNRHATLVGLTIGYELGYRHGRERRQ